VGRQHRAAQPPVGDPGVDQGMLGSNRVPTSRIGFRVLAVHGPV
jgi:hypothetical protein